MRQAKRDLESAKAQCHDGFFEWSAFIAQQAAEEAVKAVYPNEKDAQNALRYSEEIL